GELLPEKVSPAPCAFRLILLVVGLMGDRRRALRLLVKATELFARDRLEDILAGTVVAESWNHPVSGSGLVADNDPTERCFDSLGHRTNGSGPAVPEDPRERVTLGLLCLGIREPPPPFEGLDDVDEVAPCPGILVAGDPELLERMGLLPLLDLPIGDPQRLQLPFRRARGLVHRAPSLEQLAAL